jgi:hypothetical protein
LIEMDNEVLEPEVVPGSGKVLGVNVRQPLAAESVNAAIAAHVASHPTHGVSSAMGATAGWWTCQNCKADGGNVPEHVADQYP